MLKIFISNLFCLQNSFLLIAYFQFFSLSRAYRFSFSNHLWVKFFMSAIVPRGLGVPWIHLYISCVCSQWTCQFCHLCLTFIHSDEFTCLRMLQYFYEQISPHSQGRKLIKTPSIVKRFDFSLQYKYSSTITVAPASKYQNSYVWGVWKFIKAWTVHHFMAKFFRCCWYFFYLLVRIFFNTHFFKC